MLSLRKFAPVLALLTFAFCHSSFGAAQLASGATTSARPTSTNPQIRQCQITFDPDIAPSYSLTDFQLSVKYDPTLVSVQDVNLIEPFTTPVIIGAASPGVVSVDQTNGIISGIAGTTMDTSRPGQDVDIFYVDFNLLRTTSTTTPLTFTIFADPLNGDFISGIDPNTGDSITTPAADIVPTTIVFTFDDWQNFVTVETPLPSTAVAGIAILGLMMGWHFIRRRNAVCV